jgi:hypothetical protein
MAHVARGLRYAGIRAAALVRIWETITVPGIRVHGIPKTVRWSNGFLIKAVGQPVQFRFGAPYSSSEWFGAIPTLPFDVRNRIEDWTEERRATK